MSPNGSPAIRDAFEVPRRAVTATLIIHSGFQTCKKEYHNIIHKNWKSDKE
jgi:hypothetical protein